MPTKIFYTLHEDGLIIAKPRSPHKDFSLYWEITIKTECLEYFNNKKHAKTTNRRDWVRTYVPITLSVASIIISIIALIIAAYFMCKQSKIKWDHSTFYITASYLTA